MLKHNRPILNALLLAATFVVLAWYPNAVHGSACSTCQPPVRAKKWAWREAARINTCIDSNYWQSFNPAFTLIGDGFRSWMNHSTNGKNCSNVVHDISSQSINPNNNNSYWVTFWTDGPMPDPDTGYITYAHTDWFQNSAGTALKKATTKLNTRYFPSPIPGDYFYPTMLHEIGHTYALSDCYDDAATPCTSISVMNHIVLGVSPTDVTANDDSSVKRNYSCTQ
jgi:hypothetical protein